MHRLLQKLLNKQGLSDTFQLKDEEKQDFDRWQAILSEGSVTLEKVKEFCLAQIFIIEEQFKNLDNSKDRNERLILTFNVYKAILNCIEAPNAEKEALEKYLTNLIEKT